jgi:hypothetical protein
MRTMKSQAMFVLGVVALACSVIPALHAQTQAPEIDANSLVSGLALASAAVVMFRARRGTK